MTNGTQIFYTSDKDHNRCLLCAYCHTFRYAPLLKTDSFILIFQYLGCSPTAHLLTFPVRISLPFAVLWLSPPPVNILIPTRHPNVNVLHNNLHKNTGKPYLTRRRMDILYFVRIFKCKVKQLFKTKFRTITASTHDYKRNI